mmetsp:Transcript_86363/g.268299  ORF Transcript_86363/g.268299 Transcript_86363/m.268299 type:complete len:222 (-) Transcript_86363:266-931(-)
MPIVVLCRPQDDLAGVVRVVLPRKEGLGQVPVPHEEEDAFLRLELYLEAPEALHVGVRIHAVEAPVVPVGRDVVGREEPLRRAACVRRGPQVLPADAAVLAGDAQRDLVAVPRLAGGVSVELDDRRVALVVGVHDRKRDRPALDVPGQVAAEAEAVGPHHLRAAGGEVLLLALVRRVQHALHVAIKPDLEALPAVLAEDDRGPPSIRENLLHLLRPLPFAE